MERASGRLLDIGGDAESIEPSSDGFQGDDEGRLSLGVVLAGVELDVSKGEPLAMSASAQVSSLLDSEQLPFVRHAPQGM
jgi:hypothetical protein